MIPKAKILTLHEKTEEERYRLLKFHGILKIRNVLGGCGSEQAFSLTIYESIADLAFRLRDEMICREGDIEAMMIIYNLITERVNYENMCIWWARHAQPIHWIQAALLAESEDKK